MEFEYCHIMMNDTGELCLKEALQLELCLISET
jgi:hypothetical protein